MAFVVRMWRRFLFSFVGSDIQRLLDELKGETTAQQTTTYFKELDYVLLAPHQAKALRTMQKYAPREQVCELFELYERANSARPVDPATAVRIVKNDILHPQEHKVWHR